VTNKLTPKMIKCPECRKLCAYEVSNPYRPFCSERCKTHDTAKWADESHKIPGETAYSDSDDGTQN